MKILYTCFTSEFGGLEAVALKTAAGLKNEGISISILTGKNSEIGLRAEKEDIPVKYLSEGAGFIKKFRATRRFLAANKFDIIHSHHPVDYKTLFPILFFVRKPLFIITRHYSAGNKKTSYLYNLIYKRIKKVIAISNHIRNQLISNHPVKPEKVITVSNGIDLKLFAEGQNTDELKTRLSIPEDKLIITVIGRISPEKGQLDVIETAARFKSEKKIIFLFAGNFTDNDYARIIRDKEKDNDLQNVIFGGFTDKIAAVYDISDLVIIPSVEEGFGLVLIEAMASHTPVICTSAGGLAEIAENNINALVYKSGDVDALYSHISKLLQDGELRRKLTENAEETAKNYSLSRQIACLIKIYEDEIKKVKNSI